MEVVIIEMYFFLEDLGLFPIDIPRYTIEIYIIKEVVALEICLH